MLEEDQAHLLDLFQDADKKKAKEAEKQAAAQKQATAQKEAAADKPANPYVQNRTVGSEHGSHFPQKPFSDRAAAKAAKKAEKEAEKAEKERRRKEREEAAAAKAAEDDAKVGFAVFGSEAQHQRFHCPPQSKDNFGNLPLIQSSTRTYAVYDTVELLNADKAGQTVRIRGRVHTVRATGED